MKSREFVSTILLLLMSTCGVRASQQENYTVAIQQADGHLLLLDTLSTLKVSSRLIDMRPLQKSAKAQGFSYSWQWNTNKSGGRPSRKSVVVRINGKDKYFTFILFNESPFPFTTYAPQGFREEYLASDEGYSMWWLHRSQGDLFRSRGDIEDDAFVQIAFPTYIKDEGSARAYLRENAGSYGTIVKRPVRSPKRYRWSLAEYDYVRQKGDTRLTGTCVLGRHGRYFTLRIQQPEQQNEEFIALVNRLLDELVWRDTKRGL